MTAHFSRIRKVVSHSVGGGENLQQLQATLSRGEHLSRITGPVERPPPVDSPQTYFTFTHFLHGSRRTGAN